jgi:uncharacterized protein YjbI with pentapeptide repeats
LTDPVASSGDADGASTSDGRGVAESTAWVKPPSQEELDRLPADRRIELLELQRQREDAERERQAQAEERRRQNHHQRISNITTLTGALVAVVSMVITGITVWTSRQELSNTRKEQIADRHDKAVEQLNSPDPGVRINGILALEHFADESPRDRSNIRDVLAAFVYYHGPSATISDEKLPLEPERDVNKALAVLARRPADPADASPLDLTSIRTPGLNLPNAHLERARLSHAYLTGAKLPGAHLDRANLRQANLTGELSNFDNLRQLIGSDSLSTDLSGAFLNDADLTGAILRYANLNNAQLNGAILSNADLQGTSLHKANLSGAVLEYAKFSSMNVPFGNRSIPLNMLGTDLSGAILRGADLNNVDLSGTDLRGADLRGIKGMSAEKIRKIAKTDSTTRF